MAMPYGIHMASPVGHFMAEPQPLLQQQQGRQPTQPHFPSQQVMAPQFAMFASPSVQQLPGPPTCVFPVAAGPPAMSRTAVGLPISAAPGRLPSQMPSQQPRRAHDAAALSLAVGYISQKREPPEHMLAYRAVLEALVSWDLVRGLPLCADGTLRVNVPFCHSFHEAPDLFQWLADQRLAESSGARGIALAGCDLEPQDMWWRAWEAWAQHSFPQKISAQLQQQDLSQVGQPPGGLVLACHPEVTRGGVWNSIMANVLSSVLPGGTCVFTTFYKSEAEAALQHCRSRSPRSEIRENPFYAGRVEGELYTHYRYIVICKP